MLVLVLESVVEPFASRVIALFPFAFLLSRAVPFVESGKNNIELFEWIFDNNKK